MALDDSLFNAPLFDKALFDGAPIAAVAAAPDLGRDYTLEVYDSAFALLARLPNWSNGTWIQTVNEPSSLAFQYPYDDEFTVYINAYARIIGIRDREGAILDWLNVVKPTKAEAATGALLLGVECEGRLGQLARELVEDLDPGATTIKALLGTLLNDHQNNGVLPKLGMGYIDPAIGNLTVNIDVENKYVLAVIKELHAVAGGYIRVASSDSAPNSRLEWRRFEGTVTGLNISRGHNMTEISQSVDFRTPRTRIKAFGFGQTEEQRLTDTVQSDGATRAAFGDVSVVRADQSIRDQTQLEDSNARLLAAIEGPQTTTEIEIIDLSKIDTDLDYSHEKMLLGRQYNVIHEPLGISITVIALSVARSLDDPLRVEIKVSDPEAVGAGGNLDLPMRPRDFLDVVVELLRQTAITTQQDTGIYDGFTAILNDPTDPHYADLIAAIETALTASGGFPPLSSATPQSVGNANAGGPGTASLPDTHVHRTEWQTYLGP